MKRTRNSGHQGACVIARSYEMKAAGVGVGTPVWDAVRLCPDGVYLKRDFRWYEALSRRMLDAVRAFSPAVEYYSVDEFFFRAVPRPGLSLQQTAEALRDHVLGAVGVPVTVGLARTRTLAKLISDTAKPFGARAVLDPAAERDLLARTPVTEVSGIAARRAARLAPHGITTCLDLARAARPLVRSLLTRAGEALWWELNGGPVTPIRTDRVPHKTLSRGGSLGGATADAGRLNAWLIRNLERLAGELEYHAVGVGVLSICLSHAGGREGCHLVPLPAHTDRFDLLLDAARYCFRKAWVPGLAVTRMHVIASQLRRHGLRQLGLFDPPAGRARAAEAAKEGVNARLGRFAVRSGATLPLADVYRDAAQSFDICDIRGKNCF